MLTCQRCGKPMVKNGKRAYSNSNVKQRYICKTCRHSKFANITLGDICTGSLHSSMSLKEVTKTWHSRREHGSCQIVIPKTLAQKAGIYEPSQVVVEETREGLLIRRLDLR